jgi:hypothetical protein
MLTHFSAFALPQKTFQEGHIYQFCLQKSPIPTLQQLSSDPYSTWLLAPIPEEEVVQAIGLR